MEYILQSILLKNIQENILNKKYWISRKNASIRNVLNSNDVDRLLRRYNYEILYLEDLDTQEQISTLSISYLGPRKERFR